MVGEVVRILLEAYYEPRFSGRSHGFRPRRGCHTALTEVANTWKGTTWFIEGDVGETFGSLDHDVMIRILAEKIHDNRFLRLLRNMLQAGYLEDWRWHATPSGAPQGGMVSPILSSIYLHKLDTFVETVLIPEHTRGKLRRHNPEYQKVQYAIAQAHRRGDGCAACPPRTLVILATGGCAMCATPTITCSGSLDPRPRPRRSNRGARGSCATTSSWTCRRQKR